MNDKNLIRRCKALAAHACANWRDHECLVRDCPCDMIHPRYSASRNRTSHQYCRLPAATQKWIPPTPYCDRIACIEALIQGEICAEGISEVILRVRSATTKKIKQ